MKIVRTEKDIDGLGFGDCYTVDIPSFDEFAGDPDGPIKLIESEEWAEAQRLENLVQDKFLKTKERAVDGNVPGIQTRN